MMRSKNKGVAKKEIQQPITTKHKAKMWNVPILAKGPTADFVLNQS